MKKKVLHLITGLGIGGAERMLLKTLPLLQGSYEHEVYCIVGDGPIGTLLEKQGIPVTYLHLRPSTALYFPFLLAKKIRSYRPDLLVTYLIHADLIGRVIGKLCGVPKVICNQRGFYVHWKFLRITDRWTSFLVDRYIVQTQYAQKELAALLHVPKAKFTIIPNGIDLKEFSSIQSKETARRDLGISLTTTAIVCVGNLKQGKGYEELLDAFEEAFKTNSDLTLLIVGDGTEKKTYLKRIEKFSSRQHILFLGRREDVQEILALSDIFVLATYSEGMSNAILEAMASKLPVITTDIPVNKEIISHEESGLLVPPRNVSALVDALSSLLNDTHLQERLGNSAYQSILERFEIHTIIPRIVHTYNEVIYGS